nr:transposase [Frankia sp. CgIS1]
MIAKRDADRQGVPPGHRRLASPYDRDARWAAKGDDLFWCGYKVHLTETCDPPPGAGAGAGADVLPLRLITNVLTTQASVPDVKATEIVQASLAERGLTPGEHYLDAGYSSADLIHDAATRGITMVTPALLDHSPQAKANAGFDKAAFRIDWKARQVRCPQGHTSTAWYPVRQHERDAIVVAFARTDCHPCPTQKACTTSTRRTRYLSLRPRELHETLATARAEQATDTWKTRYALRAGIEGTINQALDVTGLRNARYRGLPKTRLQHAFSATAVNVLRLDAHWNPDQPPFTPRASRLTRLSQQRTTPTAN